MPSSRPSTATGRELVSKERKEGWLSIRMEPRWEPVSSIPPWSWFPFLRRDDLEAEVNACLSPVALVIVLSQQQKVKANETARLSLSLNLFTTFQMSPKVVTKETNEERNERVGGRMGAMACLWGSPGSWGSSSGPQAWRRASLPAESSSWPCTSIFWKKTL